MDNALAHLSAVDLIALYAGGKVSPVEAARASLAQIERHNETLTCFCLVDEERTLREARESEQRWLSGRPLGLVDGVPTSVKDLAAVKGWPLLRGSKTTAADEIPDEDAPPVARLREQGAVFIGKTTTPEFGWKGVTDSPLTGITRNAWNPERTPGGSSGGAATGMAAGMGTLATGSDGAGSIRIPAAFCGVFGIKPTYGLVGQYPVPAHLGNLAHIGPITRTVADAALMLQVIAQADARDWTDVPTQATDYRAGLEAGVAGMRIAFSPDFGYADVDDDVAARVRAAVDVFAGLGASVEEIEPPFSDPAPIIETMWAAADAWLLAHIPQSKHADIDPGLREIAASGAGYSAGDLIDAHAARNELGHRMSVLMERYDLLLSPQMPITAFEAGANVPAGRAMTRWLDWCSFTYPFNLTHQPAASVPCGFGDDGLPVGLQIVGARFADAKVLRACRAYEREHPFEMPSQYRA